MPVRWFITPRTRQWLGHDDSGQRRDGLGGIVACVTTPPATAVPTSAEQVWAKLGEGSLPDDSAASVLSLPPQADSSVASETASMSAGDGGLAVFMAFFILERCPWKAIDATRSTAEERVCTLQKIEIAIFIPAFLWI